MLFLFTFIHTQYLYHVHPLTPFHHLLPSPSGIIHAPLSGRTCSTFLFPDFAKERKKKWHFCLLKIATQRTSLWHFHVYMYYSPILFISSIFLLSTLVPFLWLFQPVLKNLYSFLYREYINHIHVNLLLLPSPSHVWLPLSVSYFS
jgi:hypothetical protein